MVQIPTMNEASHAGEAQDRETPKDLPVATFHSRALTIVLLLASLAAVLGASLSASTSRFNKHPDEFAHGGAVVYFMNHWWPPPLNSDGLVYQPDGISRVYNGELYYYLAGWSSSVARFVFPEFFSGTEFPRENLRWFQILLYGITLAGLWLTRRSGGAAGAVATGGIIALTGVPQLVYLYSYLNSDAWGVSVALAVTIYMVRYSEFYRTPRQSLIAGLLVGLLLVSKPNFWLALPFAAIYPFWNFLHRRREISLIGALPALGLFFVSLALPVVPLKVVYPLSQGGWSEYQVRFEQMREERSIPSFRPSAITAPGYRWQDRGVPFSRVYEDRAWHGFTAKSFYAVFGYWTALMTPRVYAGAALLGALFIVLTLVELRRSDPGLWWMIIMSPPFFALSYAASLYNSWTYDFQSQGRYLFGWIPALAILLSGGALNPNRWSGGSRGVLVALFCAAGLFLVWKHLVLNPIFSET